MAKTVSSAELSPDSGTAPRPAKTRKARAHRHSRPPQTAPAPKADLAHALQPSSLDLNASAVKPLLLGVGIGAALMGTAMVVRSRTDKGHALSPFHGPNAALATALTKTALFAVARVVSGQTVRAVATRALLEVAEAWKA